MLVVNMDDDDVNKEAKELLLEIAEPDKYADGIADAELRDVRSETTTFEVTRTLTANENHYGEQPYAAPTYSRREQADDVLPLDERFDQPPGSIYADTIEYMEHGVGQTDCPHCDSGTNTCHDCDGEGKASCPTCTDGSVTCRQCEGRTRIPCTNCDDGQVHCENCNGEGRVSCSHCDDGERTCGVCDATGRLRCPNSSCQGGRVSCSTCSGSGDVTDSCPNCSGSGTVRTNGE